MAVAATGGNRGFRGALLSVCALLAALCEPAAGFTPQSAEVRELVEKGLKYLETATDSRVGGKCLIGLAFFKDGAGEDHPKVAAAIKSCQDVGSLEPEKIQIDIYSTGIAILFLCEINSSKYRVEIDRLIKSLELRQKDCGGWGYPGSARAKTGDTSMTQYAVLSLWTASRTGVVEVPLVSVERVCNWLVRTQDPSGGWGYQGKDPGEDAEERVEQTEVRHSLCAAGLGSLYMCSDLLGFIRPDKSDEDTGLPPGLKRVKRDGGGEPVVLTKKVHERRLQDAIRDGNAWFTREYKIDGQQWQYYYMYAYERYRSFRELALGRFERDPSWYNDGVRFLTESQQENGNWMDKNSSVDTAFAILFLLRSTQRTIEKTVQDVGDGTLLGGRGLPSDVRDLRVRRGRIVGNPKQRIPDDLFAILEDSEHPEFDELVAFPTDLKLGQEPELRAQQLVKLRRLVRAESYQARRVAVRILARSRDLDSVPELIYALSDPDSRVIREARDGLRFISRRFAGFGLPDRPSLDEKLRAIDNWKKWYLSVRPGAEFLN